MIELLMTGASQKDIAEKFRLTTRTIKNEMAFLEKEGLLKQTEEQILTDLYPKAMKVLNKHLDEQIARPGMTSIDGAKAILKEPLKRVAMREAPTEEMTLERWVIEHKAAKGQIVEGEVSNAQISGPVGGSAGVLDAGIESGGEQIQSDDENQQRDGGSVGSLGGSGVTEPSTEG